MTETPPFVRWTLAFGCALREDTDWTNPEQTERQLRSLRGYGDAVHEGRLFDGICVAAEAATAPTPLGFPAAEVLGAYGGETFVHSQCDACPANVLRGRLRSSLAGCYGLLPIDASLADRWEATLEQAAANEYNAADALPTRPRWYGVWATSLLNRPRLTLLARILEASVDASGSPEHELRLAVDLAQQQALALYVELHPAGSYDEHFWYVTSHCRVCKAAMTAREHRCAVCGFVGRAEPIRKRKLRGARPYVPLARFLGERGAHEFLARYRADPARLGP